VYERIAIIITISKIKYSSISSAILFEKSKKCLSRLQHKINIKFNINVYYRQSKGSFLQILTRKIFRLKQHTVITTKIKTDPSKLHIKYSANLCKGYIYISINILIENDLIVLLIQIFHNFFSNFINIF